MSTIAAISTAPGVGGIGIIRISGKDTFKVIEKIFKPKNENSKINGYTFKYGFIIDYENNKIIDEVLVSYFIEPKSYTTENMCEINCHGGMVTIKEILELCLKNGAELAEPGEFTKRAFLNGRIDLTQAEAIIDIINSKTDKEKKEAVNQLKGNLSTKIKNIRQDIINLLVDIEASIDYPEYDVEEVTNEKALKTLIKIENNLDNLIKSFDRGKILKEGINLTIIGSPNAGKSSLLNSMLKEERAIVTDIEGTTRDTIEEFIKIDGIPIKIIDTAGIREASNEVEKIGIVKTKEAIEKSDIIIAMFDNSKELNNEDYKILDEIKNKKAIIVLNKIDLQKDNANINKEIEKLNKKIIKISLKEQNLDKEIERLYENIKEIINFENIDMDNEILITNIRHKNLLDNAKQHTRIARETILNGLPIDIISTNIKEILDDLGAITGESTNEDIINGIFSKFCLGK